MLDNNQAKSAVQFDNNHFYGDVLPFNVQVKVWRNLADVSFVTVATKDELLTIAEDVKKALLKTDLMGSANFYWLDQMNATEIRVLAEKHLIPADFVEPKEGRALMINQDQSITISINNNEHIEMIFQVPFDDLEKSWKMIDAFDDTLEQTLDFAFSAKYGYLTSQVSRVGLAVEFCTMLFLPALVFTQKIDKNDNFLNQNNLYKLSLDSKSNKSLKFAYAVSNSNQHGNNASEELDAFIGQVQELIRLEQDKRFYLATKPPARMYDIACRAYGILKYCQRIDCLEAHDLLSILWLAIFVNVVKGLKIVDFWQNQIEIQPAHIKQSFAEDLPAERAKMVKKMIEGDLQ